MKIILVTFSIIASLSQLSSQNHDYKTMRDSLTRLSCKPSDSLTIAKSNQELLSLDTSLITENIHLYYKDLAWSYSRLFNWSKDTTHVKKCIENLEKVSAHLPDSPSTYWELAFWHGFLKNCENSSFFLSKYIALSEEQYLNYEQIERLRAKCE